MYIMKDIIREGNPILRKESAMVKLPISDEDKKISLDLLGYVINSQDDKKAKELELRPGVGLAAPQVGINKKMFSIFTTDEDGRLWVLPVINPEIISTSKEITYLPGGEGCLSVDRNTCGVTPRYKKITAYAYVFDFNSQKFERRKLQLEGYVAIVFQHEYDHLFGTLFVDKIISEEEALKKGYKPLWEIQESEN